MDEAWHAARDKFDKFRIDGKIYKNIQEVKVKIDPDREMSKINNLEISAITIKDKDYPKTLKEISDPPALLYYKGDIGNFDGLALAVVGSRKYTSYGERTVEKIVKPLAKAGLVIVSGLALGIDTLAHRATLDAEGKTIAVLGNGLDSIYPATNKSLMLDIVKKGGAIISEFPVGTPSYKYNFPFRNRIIAGLAQGTLVVEAALESGSLITARAALDYNREVFAVPGSIFSESSEGPNNLIKMGAKVVTSAEDVLSELNIKGVSNLQEARKIIPDSREEAIILEILKETPVDIDKIVKTTKLDIVKINQTLTLMEMKGKVRNLGGNQYIKNS